MNCQLTTCTRRDTSHCNKHCYPYTFLHGSEGNRGFYHKTNVPTKYQKCRLSNLPIAEQNPKIKTVIDRYLGDIDRYIISENRGLFLFSIPNPQNLFGTGVGKTTTACTILNEYLIYRVKQHLKGELELSENPTYFIKASEFQNTYNSQFRGDSERQKEASESYYRMKARMKNVELLVIDDIAIRDLTEALKNELFEVIDYRVVEDKTTIYTSNHPLGNIIEMLGERICSRIDGTTYALGFEGQDKRKEKMW